MITEKYVENPDDACVNFDSKAIPYTTLISTQTIVIVSGGIKDDSFPVTNLHAKKCPHLGRYTVIPNGGAAKKRKRRQQPGKIKFSYISEILLMRIVQIHRRHALAESAEQRLRLA